MSDPNQNPVVRWHLVALLVAVLAAAVALGALGVLGEDNAARVVLGVLALVAWVLRGRTPPTDGAAAVVLALGAGELGSRLAVVS